MHTALSEKNMSGNHDAHERAAERRRQREAAATGKQGRPSSAITTQSSTFASEMQTRSDASKREEALRLQKENQESLKRSLALADKSKQSAVATSNELASQGEQLRKIESDVDEIDQTTNRTAALISSIKSWGGMLKHSLFGGPKTKPVSEQPSSVQQKPAAPKQDRKVADSVPTRHSRRAKPEPQAEDAHPGYADAELEKNRKIEDEQLDQLSGLLTDLKYHAKDINVALDEHNEVLDRIDNKVEKVDRKIQKQDREVRRLLNS